MQINEPNFLLHVGYRSYKSCHRPKIRGRALGQRERFLACDKWPHLIVTVHGLPVGGEIWVLTRVSIQHVGVVNGINGYSFSFAVHLCARAFPYNITHLKQWTDWAGLRLVGNALWLAARISLAAQLFDLKEVEKVLWVPVTLWGLLILQQIQLL